MSRSHESSVPLSREQSRRIDQIALERYGMLGLVLMENAGRNAASLLQDLGIRGPVVICCGKGNNAGDGFVMARHLENHGYDVKVLLTVPDDQLSHDASVNLQILRTARTPLVEPPDDFSAWNQEWVQADWIVDALLGTGTAGEVRDPFLSAIRRMNSAGKKLFAVDIPSGLDCDTGEPCGEAIRAQHTGTFVAQKNGFTIEKSKQFTGTVHVVDIGIPRVLLNEINLRG